MQVGLLLNLVDFKFQSPQMAYLKNNMDDIEKNLLSDRLLGYTPFLSCTEGFMPPL